MYSDALFCLLLQIESESASSTAEYLGEQTGYGIGVVIVPVLLGALYFLPAILGRKKRQAMPIFLLNLFLGWTLLGWIGALIWSISEDARPVVIKQAASAPVSVADELQKLQQLREDGHLSEEEFQTQKARLLKV